jgi:hypothetical protein
MQRKIARSGCICRMERHGTSARKQEPAMAVAATPSHTAENLGATDCRALFIEHK